MYYYFWDSLPILNVERKKKSRRHSNSSKWGESTRQLKTTTKEPGSEYRLRGVFPVKITSKGMAGKALALARRSLGQARGTKPRKHRAAFYREGLEPFRQDPAKEPQKNQKSGMEKLQSSG